jgi:hypothetical protein
MSLSPFLPISFSVLTFSYLVCDAINTFGYRTVTILTTLPLSFIRSVITALSTQFSYAKVPRIKLRAEYQAQVSFHIVSVRLAYWEG